MTAPKISWLVGALCLLTTMAMAQFKSGSRFIGGGFSIETPVAPKLAEEYSITLQPEYGKFRSANVAMGLTATLGYSHEKPSTNRTNDTYTVGVGPFAQRFFPLTSNFGFVLTGRSRLSRTSTNSKTTSAVSTVTQTNTSLGLGLSGSPGMFFAVNDRWLLLLDLGAYQALSVSHSTQSTSNSEATSSRTEYAIGRTFSLGGSAVRIRYILP